VVAWGGDGTINEVGSALVSTPAALGIVPTGSGNGLARELGLSLRPADALRAALEGRLRPLDVGELAGRFFLNIAGIGFDALVAHRFNERPSGRRGLWPYVRIVFTELRRYQPDRYTVTLDSARLECPAFMIVLANSPQYGNGIRVAPEAKLDDGRLEALVVDSRSLAGHVWRARHLLTGAIASAEGMVRRSIASASIAGTRPLMCHVDGEPFTADGPVEARVHPHALMLRL